MRWSLSIAAALLALAVTRAGADEVRTAAHTRPVSAQQPGLLDPTPVSAGVTRPNFRTVQPTPLNRRGTLFGSVYHGNNDPVNPNLLRHATPSRSRRQAITW